MQLERGPPARFGLEDWPKASFAGAVAVAATSKADTMSALLTLS
jgi:hypothetical protein